MTVDGQTDDHHPCHPHGHPPIAVVGASDSPGEPSHGVFGFLVEQGYDATPVNPLLAGRVIHHRTVVAGLGEAVPLDMVDIFRASANAGVAVDEAIRLGRTYRLDANWA